MFFMRGLFYKKMWGKNTISKEKISIFFKKIHKMISVLDLKIISSFIKLLDKNKFIIETDKQRLKDTNNTFYNFLSLIAAFLYFLVSVSNIWNFDASKITASDTLNSKITFLITFIVVFKNYCEIEKKNGNLKKAILAEGKCKNIQICFYRKISTIYEFVCFIALLIVFLSVFFANLYDDFFLFKISKIMVTFVYFLTTYDSIMHILADLMEVRPDYEIIYKRGELE